MGRRTLLLIASILVAALGTALIWLYVQGADARAQGGEQQVQTYVLTRPVAAGDPIPSDVAQPKTFPQSIVAGLALVTSPSQLRGYAKTDIAPGLPLLTTQLSTSQTAAAPAPVVDLKKDEVAMQLTLPDPQRLAGLLQPGSRIIVYAPMKVGTKTGVGVLFNNVRVLSSGPVTAPQTGKAANVPQAIITLALTNEQAKTLVLAETGAGSGGGGGAASLWFGLLPNADGLPVDKGITSVVTPGGQ